MTDSKLNDDEVSGLALSEGNRRNTGRNTGRGNAAMESEREDVREPKRIPIHEQKTMLDAHVPEGFHGHWANSSITGRIDKMLLAGYRFVNKDGKTYSDLITSNGIDSRVAMSGSDGVMYLMVIRQEYYDADQEAKWAKAEARLNGNMAAQTHDPAFYSRDEHGNQVHVSQAERVKIQNSYL